MRYMYVKLACIKQTNNYTRDTVLGQFYMKSHKL